MRRTRTTPHSRPGNRTLDLLAVRRYRWPLPCRSQQASVRQTARYTVHPPHICTLHGHTRWLICVAKKKCFNMLTQWQETTEARRIQVSAYSLSPLTETFVSPPRIRSTPTSLKHGKQWQDGQRHNAAFSPTAANQLWPKHYKWIWIIWPLCWKVFRRVLHSLAAAPENLSSGALSSLRSRAKPTAMVEFSVMDKVFVSSPGLTIKGDTEIFLPLGVFVRNKGCCLLSRRSLMGLLSKKRGQ